MRLVYKKNYFNPDKPWPQLLHADLVTGSGTNKQDPDILQFYDIPREEWTLPFNVLIDKYPYTKQEEKGNDNVKAEELVVKPSEGSKPAGE